MFANALLLIPIVIALIGVGVLIYTYAEEIIWKPCPTCEGQGQVVITTCDGREADACPDCEGSGVTRRLAMFKSCIANVGHVLKHCVLFSVCLLSSIFGLFFMYLGITGSWDPMTILMSMMGVMGVLATLQHYILPGCEWLGRGQEKVEKVDGLICTDEAGLPDDPNPEGYQEIEIDVRFFSKEQLMADPSFRAAAAKGEGAKHPAFLNYEKMMERKIWDCCASAQVRGVSQEHANKKLDKAHQLQVELDGVRRFGMDVGSDEVLFFDI